MHNSGMCVCACVFECVFTSVCVCVYHVVVFASDDASGASKVKTEKTQKKTGEHERRVA